MIFSRNLADSMQMQHSSGAEFFRKFQVVNGVVFLFLGHSGQVTWRGCIWPTASIASRIGKKRRKQTTRPPIIHANMLALSNALVVNSADG